MSRRVGKIAQHCCALHRCACDFAHPTPFPSAKRVLRGRAGVRDPADDRVNGTDPIIPVLTEHAQLRVG